MTTLTAASESPRFRLMTILSRHPLVCAAVVLFVWTLAVRLPFLHVIHDDEAFFSVVASRWQAGELPYIASYDIKAPGIFAILAGFQTLFGASLIVIKAVEILFTAWAALGLYRLVRGAGLRRTAILTAGLYPPYSLFLMGVSSPTQLIEAAFTIEAFVQLAKAEEADRERLTTFALGGLMMGCAVMVKQTAAFTALGLFGWVVWQSWRRREIRPLVAFCLMGAVPALVFGVYFTVAGHFREAFDAVVMTALDRSQVDMSEKPDQHHLGLLLRLWHFPALYKSMLVITAGALLAVLRLPRLKAVLPAPLIALLVIWYLSAAAGILAKSIPRHLVWLYASSTDSDPVLRRALSWHRLQTAMVPHRRWPLCDRRHDSALPSRWLYAFQPQSFWSA